MHADSHDGLGSFVQACIGFVRRTASRSTPLSNFWKKSAKRLTTLTRISFRVRIEHFVHAVERCPALRPPMNCPSPDDMEADSQLTGDSVQVLGHLFCQGPDRHKSQAPDAFLRFERSYKGIQIASTMAIEITPLQSTGIAALLGVFYV